MSLSLYMAVFFPSDFKMFICMYSVVDVCSGLSAWGKEK